MAAASADDGRVRDARRALTAHHESPIEAASAIHWWHRDRLRELLTQAACPVVCVGHRQPDGPDWHAWCERKADAALAIIGAVQPPHPSPLTGLLHQYLTTRQHTLSTAHLTGMEQMVAEAEYVLKEATELRDAMLALAAADAQGEATEDHWRHVRHEVADVTLADTTFAWLMPGGVTVEACIEEKTEADRGRG